MAHFFGQSPKKPGFPLQFLKKPSAFLRDFHFNPLRRRKVRPKSLFKIWNFGVANAKILPYRLQKSPKTGIFAVY
jgi:hypothetical protein